MLSKALKDEKQASKQLQLDFKQLRQDYTNLQKDYDVQTGLRQESINT